jgi:CRP-like cAMP-binding protein
VKDFVAENRAFAKFVQEFAARMEDHPDIGDELIQDIEKKLSYRHGFKKEAVLRLFKNNTTEAVRAHLTKQVHNLELKALGKLALTVNRTVEAVCCLSKT